MADEALLLEVAREVGLTREQVLFFWALNERGAGEKDAVAEAGVSLKVAAKWARDDELKRKYALLQVKIRLRTQQESSALAVQAEERSDLDIYERAASGSSAAAIADELGISQAEVLRRLGKPSADRMLAEIRVGSAAHMKLARFGAGARVLDAMTALVESDEVDDKIRVAAGKAVLDAVKDSWAPAGEEFQGEVAAGGGSAEGVKTVVATIFGWVRELCAKTEQELPREEIPAVLMGRITDLAKGRAA